MFPAAPTTKAAAKVTSTTRAAGRSARSRLVIVSAAPLRRLDASHHVSTTIPATISSRKTCCPSSGTVEARWRSEEHTSELQSHHDLVCRLLLEKKKKNTT